MELIALNNIRPHTINLFPNILTLNLNATNKDTIKNHIITPNY